MKIKIIHKKTGDSFTIVQVFKFSWQEEGFIEVKGKGIHGTYNTEDFEFKVVDYD